MPQFPEIGGDVTDLMNSGPTVGEDVTSLMGGPQVQAPKSWSSYLIDSWAPKVNIPEGIPEWQKLPGEVYNRFIEPMTSPLGAMLTGFGGAALKPLASLFPKAAGIGIGALGASQAVQVPGTIKDIANEGFNAKNVVDLTEGLTGAAAIPFGANIVRKNLAPKVMPPKSVIAKVENEAPSVMPQVMSPVQSQLDLDYGDIVKPVEGVAPVNISAPDLPVDISAKLNAAIQKTRPLTRAQEVLLSGERSDRISRAMAQSGEGQDWSKAFMSQLAGEHTKIKMEPLKLDQPDVDEIFSRIKSAPSLIGFDKAKAITATSKLLNGEVLQRNEIDHLSKLFGKDTGILLHEQLPKVDKARGIVEEFVNLPRAIMASMDVSAPFRQGIGLVGEKTFWQSMPTMLKSYGSRKVFDGVQESIQASPKFKMMQDSGLALTDLLGSNREERFMSNWAEKIPVIRNLVSPANRAYTAYLNKVRADTFDKLVDDAADAGLSPEKNLVLTKEIAGFINNATGRGSLGKWEKNAEALNSVLFSPRLIASRVKMLYPPTYINASPSVRKQYLKSMLSIGAAGNSVLALAAMGGAEIDMDSTGSDFMKAKIGNTRVDPWGGFQQYGVLGARQLLNESKSVTSGNSYELGSKFGLPTRLDVAARFAESKLHPFASFFTTLLRGKNWAGKPISIPEEIVRRYTPMITQDLYDIIQEDPALAPLVLPAIGGMGVQTFGQE